MAQNQGSQTKEKKLKWWQLSLLGVACTVGTGFFLGSHIAIEIGGPSAVVAYALAAFGAYLVYDKLSQMTAEDPMEGSFRSYAKKAFGRWAGFSSGWVYWSSELLIMGSQLTALALFSRFWFPQVPMWCFAAGYGVLGLLIIWVGTKGFERMENIFAVLKIAAIFMFMVIAILAVSGVLPTKAHGPAFPRDWIPGGLTGFWAALIFAFLRIRGTGSVRSDDHEAEGAQRRAEGWQSDAAAVSVHLCHFHRTGAYSRAMEILCRRGEPVCGGPCRL
ncbi:L-asparagine transporter-like permease [Paenibacillus sp. OAE614]